MTREEIVAYQAKETAFLATPIGRAFNRFKNAFSRAWIEDTNSGWRENASEKKLREVWAAAEKAEQEFRALIEPIALANPVTETV